MINKNNCLLFLIFLKKKQNLFFLIKSIFKGFLFGIIFSKISLYFNFF